MISNDRYCVAVELPTAINDKWIGLSTEERTIIKDIALDLILREIRVFTEPYTLSTVTVPPIVSISKPFKLCPRRRRKSYTMTEDALIRRYNKFVDWLIS